MRDQNKQQLLVYETVYALAHSYEHVGFLLFLAERVEFEPTVPFTAYTEPDVDSACVCLRRRQSPLIDDSRRDVFVKLVKRAFSQRRKMMLKLLKQDWQPEQLQRAYDALQLSPQIRAEAVTLEQFVEFSRMM